MMTAIRYSDWKAGHLELTAPEGYLLIHGSQAQEGKARHLALLDLLQRQVLDLVQVEHRQPGTAESTCKQVLTHGAQYRSRLPPALRTVRTLYRENTREAFQGGVRGVSVDRLQWNMLYCDRTLFPLLEAHGLFRGEQNWLQRFFEVKSYHWTSTGVKARAAVMASLATAEAQFSTWVEQEPARAAAFLSQAGSLALLAPALNPGIRALAAKLGSAGLTLPEWSAVEEQLLLWHETGELLDNFTECLDTWNSLDGDGGSDGGGEG